MPSVAHYVVSVATADGTTADYKTASRMLRNIRLDWGPVFVDVIKSYSTSAHTSHYNALLERLRVSLCVRVERAESQHIALLSVRPFRP